MIRCVLQVSFPPYFTSPPLSPSHPNRIEMLASSSPTVTAVLLYLLISVALVISVPLPSGLPPYEYYGLDDYDSDQYLPDPYSERIHPTTDSTQGSGTNAGHQSYLNYPNTHLGQGSNMSTGHQSYLEDQVHSGYQSYLDQPSTHLTQGPNTNIGYQDHMFRYPTSTNQLPAPYPYFFPAEHNEGHYVPEVAYEHHYLAGMVPGYGREGSSEEETSQPPSPRLPESSNPTESPKSWPSENYHVGFTYEELPDTLKRLEVEGSGSKDEEGYGEEEQGDFSASASSKKKKNRKKKKKPAQSDMRDLSDFEINVPIVKWDEQKCPGSHITRKIFDSSNMEDLKKEIVDTATGYVDLVEKGTQPSQEEKGRPSLTKALQGIRKTREREKFKRNIIKNMIDDLVGRVNSKGETHLDLCMTRAMLKAGVLTRPSEHGKETLEPDPAELDPDKEDLTVITNYVRLTSEAIGIRTKNKSAIAKEIATQADWSLAKFLRRTDNKTRSKVRKDAPGMMYNEWLRYKAVCPELSLTQVVDDLLTEAMQDMGVICKT